MPGPQGIGISAKMALIFHCALSCHIGTPGGVCLFEKKIYPGL